jgi:dethiobiotin synthetase
MPAFADMTSLIGEIFLTIETKRFFITGTDTNIGKTYVSIKLLHAFAKEGFSTLGLKPIASGCQHIDNQWINEDAWQLQQASTVSQPYDVINPLCFPEFIAPHIAAKINHKDIKIDEIIAHVHAVGAQNIDLLLCEGVGGWEVPLNKEHTTAHLAKALNFSVILVVGMRLGCLNHAILTAKAMAAAKIKIAGWIANCIEPEMPFLQENIQTLKNWLNIPLLATIPYNDEPNFREFFIRGKNETSCIPPSTFG